MPSITNIEILEGKEGAKASAEQTATSTATPPKEDSEVSGHHWTTRVMRCYNCGGLSYVNYDTRHYHDYVCCHCGADNIF